MNALSVLTLVFMLCSSGANAAKLLKASQSAVLIQTQGSAEDFNEGDQICVSAEKTLLCGPVAKRMQNKIAVRIAKIAKNATLSSGLQVTLRRMERKPSSTPSLATTLRGPVESWKSNRLVIGGNSGLNYLYPMVHFEMDVGSSTALGVMPLFFYQPGTVSLAQGFGGFLTASFSFGKSTFGGLSILAGAGAYYLSLEYEDLEEGALGIAGFAQLRYLYRFGRSNWQIGAGLGAQYVYIPTSKIELNFSGFLPMGSLYLGYLL